MTPVHFIADLYELKSKLINPIDYQQTYAEPNITYTIIQTLIATFSAKYEVSYRDVQYELKRRESNTVRYEPR